MAMVAQAYNYIRQTLSGHGITFKYDILKFVIFPYIIHVIAQKGKLLPPPIDNVWENCKL